MLERKVYNNDDIDNPRVIMCCSPHRFAVRAATHYHTRAWQTLIYEKECFILLMKTYLLRVLIASTVVPTKSDIDVILCLQMLSETLICTLH